MTISSRSLRYTGFFCAVFIAFLLIAPVQGQSPVKIVNLSSTPVVQAPACNTTPGNAGCSSVQGSACTSCTSNAVPDRTSRRISRADEDEKIKKANDYIKNHDLSWTAGKTSVSDLTPEAYSALLGLKHPPKGTVLPVAKFAPSGPVAKGALPASFDWRNNGGDWTTPIKNQGSCGSCWAFASIGTFESFWERSQNNASLNPNFAEQYLVSCDSEDTGCGGGFSSSLGYLVDKAGSSGGIGTVLEGRYPYTASDSTCKSLTGETRYKVPSPGTWNYLEGDCVISPVEDTKRTIYERGPVNAYIDATDLFSTYTSGIFEDPTWVDGGACQTNHVIVLVGWGHDPVKNKDYWIAKNSWGTDWGENGWFRIYTDQCRIGEGIAYLQTGSGDLIGTFRNGNWYVDYNRNNAWNGAVVDRVYGFGSAGALPVTGDWNNNGKDEIGIFRNGTWRLDYNGNGVWDGSKADRLYSFSPLAESSPVTGDWNNDGKDEIGVFRNGNWRLDYNGNGVWDGASVDRAYAFGASGYTPVTGDWNGDGRDEIGDNRNGNWRLDYNANGAWNGASVDRAYTFGSTGAVPVVGNWNNDYADEIGTFRNGIWYLDYNGNGIWNGSVIDRAYSFGSAGSNPVAGKWVFV